MPGLTITKISLFDERIDELWSRISNQYRIMAVRNKDYLNWRYGDPRGGDYIIKICEKDNRILGYSVLRINYFREDYPEGYIMDLLALPSHADVITALVEDSLSYFNNREINVVRFLVMRDHRYEIVMKKYGFHDSLSRSMIDSPPISKNEETERDLNKFLSNFK